MRKKTERVKMNPGSKGFAVMTVVLWYMTAYVLFMALAVSQSGMSGEFLISQCLLPRSS